MATALPKGKFITFEGVDGAGKSSQHVWAVEHLRGRGMEVVSTREPGGTPLGEKLRGLLLAEPMHLETEALLMFAARREHIEQVIRPALARGAWVLSDRFTDASFAYQGGGRGLDVKKLQQLEHWVQGEGAAALQPDRTFIFDIPIAEAQQRQAQRQNGGNGPAPDRFEQEKLDFHERVRAAYLARARQFPERIRVIDARQGMIEINKLLEKEIASIC
ncbi:MAG TPA: dTMP kinase [Rhodocyclaceae bacterium]|nr:dTMP kinase [Rhodocyclaceae bacterium]